jgi:microsomal epoxide hydrolase
VELDGVPIHYLRRRGVGPAPVPLLLVHGWPWTFWDWHATIEPLADPGAHGANPSDAFDVVVVSLPGFAFSTPLDVEGVAFPQFAALFHRLMTEVLGYGRYGVSGGDMGTLTAAAMGHAFAPSLVGVHLLGVVPLDVFTRPNPLVVLPDFGRTRGDAEPTDAVYREPASPRRAGGSAHLMVHALEPQTLAAGLNDSPAGLLAWLLHRRYWWSHHDGDLSAANDADFLLTTFSLYWFTDSIASSVRRYHDMVFRPWTPVHDRHPVVEAPTGITFFDHDDLTSRSRFWCPDHFNVVRAAARDHGGHFAPSEVPEVVVDEVRRTFRLLR